MTVAASMDLIKRLREETSCGVIDCKKALEEAKGNFDQAKALLAKRGLEMAQKKGDRVTKEGRIEAYIHNGKVGVLVEVNCETDFVARNEDFMKFTKDLAMQIAAMAPLYIKESDIPAEVLAKQPDQKGYVKNACLLSQAFIKDPGKSIQDLLNELIAKIGENIVIGRFIRFKVGE